MNLIYRLEQSDIKIQAIKELADYYNCSITVDEKDKDLYLGFDNKFEIYEFGERYEAIKENIQRMQNMFTL